MPKLINWKALFICVTLESYLIFLSGLKPSHSQTSAIHFTLAQTIAAAMHSSTDLMIANRQVKIDQLHTDEVLSNGNPKISTSLSSTRYDQATFVRFGMGPSIQVNGSHTERIHLGISKKFDISGQIQAAANQDNILLIADQLRLSSIGNIRAFRAKVIYYNLLRSQHQVNVAASNLSSAQQELQLSENLRAGQVGQKLDVYRAATQVANDRQSLTAALNNNLLAEQIFNDLVGLPLTDHTSVDDVEGINFGMAVYNSSSRNPTDGSAVGSLRVSVDHLNNIDINKSIQDAYQQRPDILIDLVNIRAAQNGITLARSGTAPSLSIGADTDYFPTLSFQSPRQRTAAITATLTVPIYDGGLTRDRVLEAKLKIENANTTLTSDQSSVALDVRQSYLTLMTAAHQIDAVNTALEQAIAARKLAQVRYAGQVGLYLEVSDAQAALAQAENSQVNAVYDYFIANARFEYAVGTPFISTP